MSVVAPPHSPYKGLAAYDDSDGDALLFFGRERETEVIAANLQAARLTVLYGPSGVGKSSILRAGVARRLRQEADASVKIVDSWAGDAVAAVREAVGATPDGVDIYLILDQFEEYFVYHRDSEELPELLGTLTADARSRVNVLIGIREDALAELDAFRRAVPHLLANRLQLDLLDRRAARNAIVKPIERYNELTGDAVQIEAALVERILDEVVAGRVDLGRAGRGGANGAQSDRIEAPYLQLVLQTIWEAELANGSRLLRVETLERLGGAARIVHEHLEHAMAELTMEEKQAAAAMYNHLVTPSGTKIAHGVGDLAGYASLPEAQASRVLEKLARERIVRASSEDGPASARYEIFHDVLADAVLAWRARHEEQRALHEAERRRRRAFAVATAALVGLILVGAIAVFALVERSHSRSQAQRAHAEELAAEALTQLGIDPPSSLRMAYEAARLRPGTREEAVLRSALTADRLRGIRRTGGPVTAVGYDAAGRLAVVASRDGKARLYRRGSLRAFRVLGNGAPVTTAEISRDGRYVVTGDEDGRVRVWITDAGDQVASQTAGGPVRSVAFAKRAGWIVAGTASAIHVWRLDGAPVASIALHGDAGLVKAVASPDGRRVIAVLRESVARVYALPSGKALYRLRHDGLIEDAAFSPDGRSIVTGGYAGDAGGVRLWDARSGRLKREIVGALRHVHDVAFSADGKLVAAGGADGTARVWESATGVELAIMIGHTNEVTSVDFNRAGTALVSASSDGTARVWGASGGRAGRLLHVLAGHRGAVTAAVFASDGRAVLTGGEDGTARLWDPGSEPSLTLLARSRTPITDLGVAEGGRRLFTEHENGEAEMRALDGRFLEPAIRGDDVASHDQHVVRISLDGRTRVLHPRGAPIHDIALDRGPITLAVALDNGNVQLWDPRTGRLRRTLHGHTLAVNSVDFSPDQKLLVSSSADRDARIWNVKTGRLVQKLHGHFGPVLDARFSLDGRWVVTAGPITAGLWLVGSDAPPIFLDAPVERPLSAAAFAGQDGRLVVAASLDGSLRSYYCDICGDVHELLALAKRRLAAER
jgi:YD repeat-containing protein